ncbi:MAG: hypothetical protein AB1427_07925 [Thermodesulfobacteriota bacterium]
MSATSKTYVFIFIFSLCLILYMVMPIAYEFYNPGEVPWTLLENSANGGTEFVLLMLFSLVAAFGLTSLIDALYVKIQNWRVYRPKMGEIMKSLGLISEEDLRCALEKQKVKLSDILVQAGRITPEQRDLALSMQKKKNKMIGEILIELGFITEGDLRWALKERNKKIGGILKEMRLVSEYDIECALMLEKKGRMDKSGRIIDLQ